MPSDTLVKIQHHEIVKRFVADSLSPSGLREHNIRRVSTTGAISFPDPGGGAPTPSERGGDGSFSVPQEVADYFVSGSSGHPRPGWSLYTGEDEDFVPTVPAAVPTTDVSALLARLDDLEAKLAEAQGGKPARAAKAPTS